MKGTSLSLSSRHHWNPASPRATSSCTKRAPLVPAKSERYCSHGSEYSAPGEPFFSTFHPIFETPYGKSIFSYRGLFNSS